MSTKVYADSGINAIPLDAFDYAAPASRDYDRIRPLALSRAGAKKIVDRLWQAHERTGKLKYAEWALVYGYNWWRVAPLGPERIRIARIGRRIAASVETQFPEAPVGYFWGASYAGLEALSRGILDALQLIPDNLRRLEWVDARFPDYFYGGAALLLGKGYIKIPPFPLSIGNLDKGLHYLNKAADWQKGKIAMWYLFYAEAVYLKTGSVPQALAVLDRIGTDVHPVDAGARYALETALIDAASFRKALKAGNYNKYTWDPLLTPLNI